MRTRINTLKGIWVVCLVFLLVTAVSISGADEPRPVPGKFIVKLSPAAKTTEITRSLGDTQHLKKLTPTALDNSLKKSDRFERYYTYYQDNPDLTAEDVISALGAANIEYIEPDYYLDKYELPVDSLFPHQWYLHNTGQEYYGILRRAGSFNDSLVLKSGTAGSDVNILPFYNNPPTESTRVVVAVIDTGVDPLHPELSGRFWVNPDEIPDNGIDDDHNGYIDDINGYDLSGDSTMLYEVVGDNDPSDYQGHGTHIAGIIAANANDFGVAGISSRAEIMAVKTFPNATTSIGSAGIIYAVNAGARVLNISWGTTFESYLLKEAVLYARENGVIVCVASGNSGTFGNSYPGSFMESFTVGAGNSDGFLTDFSTYGPQVDIIAPGRDILSLRATGMDMYAEADEPFVRIIDSMYYLSDGTSMAAPMVVGAAAFLLSIRPDLTIDELEDILQRGADDMIDPLNKGDTLIGFDSLSGYGYLNIAASYNLLFRDGIHIVEPLNFNRYSGAVAVRVAPVAGYIGNWRLDYSIGQDSENWLLLAEDTAVPSDSLAVVFDMPAVNDFVNIRLTDSDGNTQEVTIIYVNDNLLTISSPVNDEEMQYNIPIYGSIYGPDYESLTISYRFNGEAPVELMTLTSEIFDTLIFNWNISGLEPGRYTIILEGTFGAGTEVDTVSVLILSSFASGWPQTLTGRGALTAVAGDLDNDGFKEIIVGTDYGLNVFSHDGQPLPGFPALDGIDSRCVPAVYDIDRDGRKEIIVTNEEGIYVFNDDGSIVSGWPRFCPTGFQAYGYPTPVVTQFSPEQDSVIAIIDEVGDIYAYKFDGSSYFYSLEGYFASFNQQPSSSFYYGGNAVTSADLLGNGVNEVIVTYSSSMPYTGVGLFEGRNGLPAFDMPQPYVLNTVVVYGTVLADLNSDLLPEIITSGYDADGTRTLWALTYGTDILPGWPVTLPAVDGWLSSFPMAADLDLDDSPEILCTFFELDIASLYIFRADGTPYISISGRPEGEVIQQPVTFGVPMVADLTGDEHPEIIIRSGHIFPGTGTEMLYILDYTATPLPGWPIETPTRTSMVFSTPFAPLVDDIDHDDKVELILIGEANDVYVWDFDASSQRGKNTARLFLDNHNSSNLTLRDIITDVKEKSDDGGVLPRNCALAQNYPNPFNPATEINFSLPERVRVKLDVYNVLGQKVTTLVDDNLAAGNHQVKFDGTPYASGVYLYRLTAGEQRLTRKMVLIK
ncbi:MAG: S8 family serine peptidase [Candidatus Zixiibacteriota bacterium]